MPRHLDATLAAHLGDPHIATAIFAEIRFRSGIERVWSGVGDFVGPNGFTFTGVGNFGGIGAIGEGTDVKAEGTTITLSGIGDSLIDIPDPPVTPPDPPVPPGPGESVAWSFARGLGLTPPFNNPPSLWNDFLGCSGFLSGSSGVGITLGMTNGQSILGLNSMTATWAGFNVPPEIPVDANITHVYAVITCSGNAANCSAGVAGAGALFVGPGAGGFSLDVTTNGGLGNAIEASVVNSLPGSASLSMGVTFVGMAVYYTGTPKTKMSLLQEALGDVWVGAPVKIWFGLINLSTVALLGTPYLIFSGLVDKPSIHIGLDTLAITLALENRLVNLQRANQRRYTAADQKIYYPTDMAFNWVEALNDIALRWGS